jgi:hypothetical protein
MQQEERDKRRPRRALPFDVARRVRNSKVAWAGGALVVIVIILALVSAFMRHTDYGIQSQSYVKVSGAAGLKASIQYDCASNCQHTFDFNVYILNDQGQQVSVVRPDKDGVVRSALPEGNYVLLIGKELSKDKIFPQVPVVLKGGQQLELKLRYGGIL